MPTVPAQASSRNDRLIAISVCIFLTAIIWIVFGQTLGHEFVNFDDDRYVYENERVSLGVKQLTPDPWSSVSQRYPLNTRVRGKVSSVADFGVFVELEEGIEGLIHISQLSNERVDKPSSLFKVDDELEAIVVQVDSRERRIGLSIKALKQHEEREEMQAYLKREHEAARFSMEDILNEELRLDRDESGRASSRGQRRDR